MFCHLFSTAICYGNFKKNENTFYCTCIHSAATMINIFYSKLSFTMFYCSGRKEVCSLRVNKRRVLMSHECATNERKRDKCTFWMHFSSSRVFSETLLNVYPTAQTSEIVSFSFPFCLFLLYHLLIEISLSRSLT